MLGRIDKTVRRCFLAVCPGDVEKSALLLCFTLGISIEYEHKTSKDKTLKFSLFVCSRKFSQSYAQSRWIFLQKFYETLPRKISWKKRKKQEFEVLQLHRATDPSNDLGGIYKIVSSLFDERAWIRGQLKDLPRFRDRSVLWKIASDFLSTPPPRNS